MFSWLMNLFTWLVGIWSKLPDSAKEKIIDLIVETFDAILRAFYRSEKKGNKNV